MKSYSEALRRIGAVVILTLPFAVPIQADGHDNVISIPIARHTPGEVAKQFKVRDGFEVHLVAAEPDVVDPVSAVWSSDGKLWVVEMSDYPQPRPGQIERHGRIRVLSERDAHGRFQQSITFADGLDFATGVLPWRGGAIVTLAGQIVYLQDVDGDGAADNRAAWFEGFTVDNEQLRANHPTLGPDGWVYVASGLRGGEIRAIDPRFETKPKPVKLHGRDFVFDPHGGSWGTVSGNSQHGMTVDDFNRRIGCSNRNPALEPVLSADVINCDPFLNPQDAVADVGKAGFESEVHPISHAWTTSNLHAGQFSAACGVFAPGWTGDDSSAEWLLVCEPTGSLVQRQRLRLVNGLWQSEREATKEEWLACGDDWFRPVDLLPDVGGGVLVIDMARAVIEHPQWAPPELKDRPDTFDGIDLGRIWLVTNADVVSEPSAVTNDTAAIVAIESRFPLSRQLSTAYWFDHYSADSLPSGVTIDSLTRILNSSDDNIASKARVALLLNRWGLLNSDLHQTLLNHDSERLRVLGLKLRPHNDSNGMPIIESKTLALGLSDPSRVVRRAALETLVVSANQSDIDETMLRLLQSVAIRDGNDTWMQKLLTALPSDIASKLLSTGLPLPHVELNHCVPLPVLKGWMRRVAAKDQPLAAGTLQRWLQQIMPTDENGSALSTTNRSMRELVMQVFLAWKAGNEKGNQQSKKGISGSKESAMQFSTIDLLATLIAFDDQYSIAARLDAIAWIGELPTLSIELRKLVDNREDAAVRAAAYRLLVRRDGDWAKQFILNNVDSISPSDRSAIVDTIRGDNQSTNWLLKEIGRGGLPRTFVDPSSMDRFRNHSDSKIAQLANQIFAPPGDVVTILREYAASTSNLETANIERGAAIFAQHCANCHRINNIGYAFGPDISDSRVKTPESFLVAILDPSAAIDASFVAYQLLTIDGEVISGLLAGETREAIALALPGGQTRRVSRDDIETFRSSSRSLMPEGLQRVIDVGQMRDLIAYLKRWRYQER